MSITPEFLSKLLNVQTAEEASALTSEEVKQRMDDYIRDLVRDELRDARALGGEVFGAGVSDEVVMQIATMISGTRANLVDSVQDLYDDLGGLEGVMDEYNGEAEEEYDADEDYEDDEQEQFHDEG